MFHSCGKRNKNTYQGVDIEIDTYCNQLCFMSDNKA